MGGAMGNPIDDAQQARINEIIQDVTTRFAVEFSLAYTQAVVVAAKLEARGEEADSLKLLKAPLESEPLKTGMLGKRGNGYKSWKERFFVVYNEKDNFKIDYFDGKDEKGKLKGTIHCDGYHVDSFDKEDIQNEGSEFGIKLVPYSSRRRTWYMKAANKDEMKEWMSVFRKACYKSKAPCDEDPLIAEAFDTTLTNIRWHFWFWSWGRDGGAEPERLGSFLMDVLEREVLREVVRNIPDNAVKSTVVDTVYKTIGATVNSACMSCWASSSAAVRQMSVTIMASVKNLISPIVEQETKLKTQIVDVIGSVINPALEGSGAKLLRPVLDIVYKPITNIYISGAQGFKEMIQEKMKDGKVTPKEISQLHRSVGSWYGFLRKAYDQADDVYHGNLTKAAGLLGAISPYDVYNLICDQMQAIMHRAIYTFETMIKDVTDFGPVLDHCMSLLMHDCMVMINETVKAIFLLLLESPMSENVIKPSMELVAPIQETIDAIPVPGLSTLLNLKGMMLEVVCDIEGNAIEAILSESAKEAKNSIDLASVEMGVQNISV